MVVQRHGSRRPSVRAPDAEIDKQSVDRACVEDPKLPGVAGAPARCRFDLMGPRRPENP